MNHKHIFYLNTLFFLLATNNLAAQKIENEKYSKLSGIIKLASDEMTCPNAYWELANQAFRRTGNGSFAADLFCANVENRLKLEIPLYWYQAIVRSYSHPAQERYKFNYRSISGYGEVSGSEILTPWGNYDAPKDFRDGVSHVHVFSEKGGNFVFVVGMNWCAVSNLHVFDSRILGF